MKKIILLAILTSGLQAFAMPAVGGIGFDEYDTPSCSVTLPDGKVIFADEMDARALMRLDGNLTEFTAVGGSKRLWDFWKIGETVEATYVSPLMDIKFQGVVTELCGPIENCEIWGMDLKAIISDTNEVMNIVDLKAVCGV